MKWEESKEGTVGILKLCIETSLYENQPSKAFNTFQGLVSAVGLTPVWFHSLPSVPQNLYLLYHVPKKSIKRRYGGSWYEPGGVFR